MKHIRCDFCQRDNITSVGEIRFCPPPPDYRLGGVAIDYSYTYDACQECFAKIEKLCAAEYNRPVEET